MLNKVNMQIILRSTFQKIKTNVEQDFYWYDQSNGNLLHGRGGKLSFKYDRFTKKNIPFVEDNYKYSNGNNYENILSWIKSNKYNYNFSIIESVRNHYCILDIKDGDYEDMSINLYANRIMHDEY